MRDPGLRNQLRTELQVGLVVVLAFFGLIAGVAWLAGFNLGGERLELFVETTETTEVAKGSRVELLGVDIGSVVRVHLMTNSRVVAELEVNHEHTLPRDTKGVFRSSGFIGAQVVELLPGTSSQALVDGDTIQGTRLPDLSSMAGDLGDKASDIMTRTQQLLSDSTVAGFQASSQSMAAALGEIEGLVREERESLKQLIEGLSQTSTQLASATSGPELGQALGRLDSLTMRLTAASSGLDSTTSSLASILGKIDRGEGTIGKMVNDTTLYGRLAAVSENLQSMTEEMTLLTKNIRDEPERYLGELKISVF
ncbi:MAG: MlaD family protein [Gemmatimonadota bacterium]